MPHWEGPFMQMKHKHLIMYACWFLLAETLKGGMVSMPRYRWIFYADLYTGQKWFLNCCLLTHWGQVTHLCVSRLAIIRSDNGLSPGRCQAIFWTNAGILLIGPPGTNFNEILTAIHTFSFKKIHLKLSFGKWRPSYLCLNVLKVLCIFKWKNYSLNSV